MTSNPVIVWCKWLMVIHWKSRWKESGKKKFCREKIKVTLDQVKYTPQLSANLFSRVRVNNTY